MFAIIVLLIFGMLIALFAIENTTPVTIHILRSPVTIRLFLLVLISMLFGFFVSWILSLFGVVSSAFKMHSKDSALKEGYKEYDALAEKLRKLELENEKLKGKLSEKA